MSIKRLAISEVYTYPLFTKYVPYAPNDNFSIVVIETPFNIIHYLRHRQFSSDHNIPKDIAEALYHIQILLTHYKVIHVLILRTFQ